MVDGVALATAGPSVKKRAYQLAIGGDGFGAGIFSTRTGTLITFGHPGAERTDDMVYFGDWRVVQEPGPLSRSNRSRDEAIEFDVIFSSYRGGGWRAELDAADASEALCQDFEYYVRQTNTELATSPGAGDGVARYCFMTAAQAEGFTVVSAEDPQIEVGRNVSITATFAAVVSITGSA